VVNEVLFWAVAALTVIPATALLFARKGVHIAMSIVTVMVGLAAAYVALEAPFLGIVQIVVYTGAIMMLFLFVLMLIGVDQREDLKETIKGQRWIAFFAAGGIGTLLIVMISRVTISLQRPDNPVVGEPDALAMLLFGPYVLVMEVLGFLLITSAVGALVLTHVPRLTPRRTQAEIAEARVLGGANPVNKPMPGVYARHNALDVPALDPEGKPIAASISRVLKARGQTRDGKEFLPPASDAEGDQS
jgi:NADH-quinone oxidoreductase subunit J